MNVFMNKVAEINSAINSVVWGPIMLVLLVGTGLFLSIRTKFISITKLNLVFKSTIFTLFEKSDGEDESGQLSPFQALSTALAATVGTGNIAGVATAIAAGGPGAIFWMWVAALVGMTTKFSEIVLSIKYREQGEDGRFHGGPMYYIKNGLSNSAFSKVLAGAFAFFGAIAAFGIGNAVQANSITTAANNFIGEGFFLGTTTLNIILGVIIALMAFSILSGGVKRIGQVTTFLVPFMALFYILGGIIILVLNASQIIPSISLIFKCAFTGHAAVGGFAGAAVTKAMRSGIARGVFTNEAGLGSSPIAHAVAKTDHPVRQGLWGIFEVFVDTLVICTMTALVIMTTNTWSSGVDGAQLTIDAFSKGLPGSWGGLIVSVGLVLFSFSTILGWYYYGQTCAEYFFGSKIRIPYRILYCIFTVVGAAGGLSLVWEISDTLNAMMAIPNLIALIMLSGTVVKLTKEFFTENEL